MRRLTSIFASHYESNSATNRLINTNMLSNAGKWALLVIWDLVSKPCGHPFLSYSGHTILWRIAYSHRQSLRAEIYYRRWFDTPMRNADVKTHCLHRTACTHSEPNLCLIMPTIHLSLLMFNLLAMQSTLVIHRLPRQMRWILKIRIRSVVNRQV